MKGLDAPQIIAIIIAVLAGALILYLFWSKGMIPFLSGANEEDCIKYFVQLCNSNFSVNDPTKDATCASIGKKYGGSAYDSCFSQGAPDAQKQECVNFCNNILRTS